MVYNRTYGESTDMHEEAKVMATTHPLDLYYNPPAWVRPVPKYRTMAKILNMIGNKIPDEWLRRAPALVMAPQWYLERIEAQLDLPPFGAQIVEAE